jgi:protein-arginine kinase activator protein McsA
MPAITLLKRQLTLAVKEEDYREAARLRDHTWWVGRWGVCVGGW